MKSWILSDEELVVKLHTLRAHGMDIERYQKEWDAARYKLTAHRRQNTSSAIRAISGVRFGGGESDI